MATRIPPSMQYQRPEGRADFERARRALKSSSMAESLDAGGDALLELGAALDAGVARIKRELLASALCWNEENQQVGAWIHEQHRKLAEMGEELVYASAARAPASADFLPRLVALTLFHWGEAVKWAAGRERRDYAPLHGMLAMMLPQGRYREPMNVTADGRGRSASVESLYFRALLLDRFASGNLTRQQIEVLDAWLWEWVAQLQGSGGRPEGAFLRVDLDANAGLREGARIEPGPCLYLPLAALEGLRRAVVQELHRGRIVPAHGCAAEMRIEEHVTVLEALRRAFEPAEDAQDKRAQRTGAPGTRLEVWVGIEEIMLRGMGIGVEARALPALSLIESPLVPVQGKTAPQAPGGVDPTRRYLWLADISATGCGFEALESDAAGIEVGEVLGWRRTPRGACQLGRVIRRMPSATDGQVFLGVHLLTDCAHPLGLARANAFDEGGSEVTHLFVPGDEASGRHDAFLVPESTYPQDLSYNTSVGEEKFQLRFNRIRDKGRGWILAGFEVMPRDVQPPRPCAPDEELRFVLDDDLDRAFDREVSARLLSA